MLQLNIIVNYGLGKKIAYEHDSGEFIDNENNRSAVSSPKIIVTNEEEQRLRQQRYRNKISLLSDFNQAFELVKSAVEDKFKMHRAGLSLVLQGLPTNLGAYHVLGSNLIIVNKRIIDIIKKYKSHEEYNSYLFMVLAHEYLHSFGIIEEWRVRKMTYDLISSLVGENHIATKVARYQPWELFPELSLFSNNSFEHRFEIIRDFDKTTQSYIG
jgi:DNA-directed RNA polymerase subunit F